VAGGWHDVGERFDGGHDKVKSYRIASDTPVDPKPNESGAEGRYTNTQRGAVSHKALLGEFRKRPVPREIHSDGFLALSSLGIETAYECGCGFTGIFKSEKCVRCGEILGT